MGKVNRRASLVQVTPLRIRADQTVQVTGLELVGIASQRLAVADAVVARPRVEQLPKGERAQRGVAARASASDRQSVWIRFMAAYQEAGSVDAIVNVHDSPLAVEALPIGATIARAAA